MNSTIDFNKNPLNKIIGLAIILSMGFLLVVLAGISGNWFPIVDGLIFAVAYLPVILARLYSSLSDYDFNFDPNSVSHSLAAHEVSLFVSAFLLVTGVYVPILLSHSLLLSKTAVGLTLTGGFMIFGTVYTFTRAFEEADVEDLGGGVI